MPVAPCRPKDPSQVIVERPRLSQVDMVLVVALDTEDRSKLREANPEIVRLPQRSRSWFVGHPGECDVGPFALGEPSQLRDCADANIRRAAANPKIRGGIGGTDKWQVWEPHVNAPRRSQHNPTSELAESIRREDSNIPILPVRSLSVERQTTAAHQAKREARLKNLVETRKPTEHSTAKPKAARTEATTTRHQRDAHRRKLSRRRRSRPWPRASRCSLATWPHRPRPRQSQ